MEATQDEQAKVLGNRVAELDAQLLEMVAHLDEEFYPRFLTSISGRRWIWTHGAIGCAVNKGIQDGLRAGVDHGKAGRDLSVIESYDPSMKAKYINVVNALGTVDLSLLFELKSKKDASIVDLMDSFTYSKSLIGEASTSAAPAMSEPITTLSTTFASSDVVPPLSISNDQVLDTEPHDEDPPVVTFKKEELDTYPE
ncbi:hypothetical protein Tco_1219748 [Tanacetum coccineum]